ncbi:hypothetical protein RI367_000732 [Sorochytrium milnesiophthora]
MIALPAPTHAGAAGRRTSVSFGPSAATRIHIPPPAPPKREIITQWLIKQSTRHNRNNQFLQWFQILTCVAVLISTAGASTPPGGDVRWCLYMQLFITLLSIALLHIKLLEVRQLIVLCLHLAFTMMSGLVVCIYYFIYANYWQTYENQCNNFANNYSACPSWPDIDNATDWTYRCAAFLVCQSICVHSVVSHLIDLISKRKKTSASPSSSTTSAATSIAVKRLIIPAKGTAADAQTGGIVATATASPM